MKMTEKFVQATFSTAPFKYRDLGNPVFNYTPHAANASNCEKNVNFNNRVIKIPQ